MKRFISIFLTFVAILSMCSGMAYAMENGVYSSLTLTSYNARLRAGNTAGSIRVSFDVKSSKLADSLGVSAIVIYNEDGEYITSVAGTTSNGLICESDSAHMGTYPCTLTSGTSYYAEVTVFATVGRITDQKVITTNVVTAP